MTRILLTCLFVASLTANAATIACPGSSNDTGPLLLSTIVSSPGFSCEQQDKIYSDFSIVSGSPSSDLSVRIQFQPQADGTDLHTVTFTGALDSNNGDFVIAYMVGVDPIVAPNSAIIGAGVAITASGNVGNPMVIENSTAFAPPMMTSLQGSGHDFRSITPGVTTIGVVDSFMVNGGAAQGFSNSFTQATPQAPTPEAMTLLLMGTGLVTIGGLKFRKNHS
jgi:hypothetical protein